MPQGLPNGARRSPRAWPLKSKGTAVVMAKLCESTELVLPLTQSSSRIESLGLGAALSYSYLQPYS